MTDKVQFCEIGMGRTATRSMARAMKDLGFSVSHGSVYFKNKSDLKNKYLHDLLYGVIPKYPYENYEFVGNLPSDCLSTMFLKVMVGLVCVIL